MWPALHKPKAERLDTRGIASQGILVLQTPGKSQLAYGCSGHSSKNQGHPIGPANPGEGPLPKEPMGIPTNSSATSLYPLILRLKDVE